MLLVLALLFREGDWAGEDLGCLPFAARPKGQAPRKRSDWIGRSALGAVGAVGARGKGAVAVGVISGRTPNVLGRNAYSRVLAPVPPGNLCTN